MNPSEKTFRLETLKLLVSVAWADREISDAEVETIIDTAETIGATTSDIRDLRRALANDSMLMGTDFSVLETRTEEVLGAVDGLIALDGIAEDENAVRAAIERLLSLRTSSKQPTIEAQ